MLLRMCQTVFLLSNLMKTVNHNRLPCPFCVTWEQAFILPVRYQIPGSAFTHANTDITKGGMAVWLLLRVAE